MKKIIAILLVAAFAVLALASCNNGKQNNASTPSSTKPATPAATTATGSYATTPESTPEVTPDEMTFETRDETVYTTADLKLRTSNYFNSDSNVAEIVPAGTELKRVAISIEENGSVSKVVYNNAEYFCGSKFLTTEVPSTDTESTGEPVDETVVFEDKDETVKVIPDEARVYTQAYKGWSTSNIKNTANFVLTKDTEVKVTGVCYESETDHEVGWARIEYQNNVYYVRISVLKLTPPTADTTPESTAAATVAATPAATEAQTTPEAN